MIVKLTKEEFKEMWDNTDYNPTFDELADFAMDWGLIQSPRCCDIFKIRYLVLKATGVSDAESYNPENIKKT